MNLYKVGISGITAAEANIATTAHNISNMATPGYNRQSVMVSSAGAQAAVNGYIGRGVQIDGVARAYDAFQFQQLTQARGKGAELSFQADQLAQISAAVADRRVGISPALTAFFTSVNAMASSPSDPAVRQDLLGKSNTLVSQFQAANAELQATREGINSQISTAVEQVNSYLHRINTLNKDILASQGAQGQMPNDLLDARDQALAELNQLVGIQFSEQGNVVNVSLANGQALIAGNAVFELQAVTSATDPQRVAVGVTLPGAGADKQVVELRDAQVSGGKLGGLTKVRSETLDTMQAEIGQLAVGLALAFNAVHANGQAPSGAVQDYFSLGTPTLLSNANNTGNLTLSADYAPVVETIDAAGNRSLSEIALEASDYSIVFKDGAYSVTRSSDNKTTTFAPGQPPDIPGLVLNLGGTPADGDSWVIQPTRNAARDVSLNISRPEDIASAGSAGGAANGENALALAKLQTARVFDGGTTSATELYAKTVNSIGVQTQAAQTGNTAQNTLISQKLAAQQAVSGVVANVEYVNLTEFQNQYQASAKIIDVASTLFDTLLGMRG